MNFVYEDGKIYFHGAKEGHKIDAIKNNPKVSMSIIDQEDVIEEELTTYFRSVILFGKLQVNIKTRPSLVLMPIALMPF